MRTPAPVSSPLPCRTPTTSRTPSRRRGCRRRTSPYVRASSSSGVVGLRVARVAGYCLPSAPVREVGTVPTSTGRIESTKWLDTPHSSAIARLESPPNSLTAISTHRRLSAFVRRWPWMAFAPSACFSASTRRPRPPCPPPLPRRPRRRRRRHRRQPASQPRRRPPRPRASCGTGQDSGTGKNPCAFIVKGGTISISASQFFCQNLSTGHPTMGVTETKNTPKTENGQNPHGGQYWLAKKPLTEF